MARRPSRSWSALDPGHAVPLGSIVKEYQKSVSELTVLCTAHGIALQRTLALLGVQSFEL